MTGVKGMRWASVKPCGTLAAYNRHRRRGEVPCDACTEANRQRNRDRRAATKAAARSEAA